MKYLGLKLMEQSGLLKNAEMIEKRFGIKTIDYSTLTFKNRKSWLYHTVYWTGILSEEYLAERIEGIRKDNPKYMPNLVDYANILQQEPLDTITFLIAIDGLCLKATGNYYPDELFAMTYPPEKGPIEDTLIAIINLKKTISVKLLDNLYSSIGLLFSQKTKSFDDPSTLTKRDMEFLAHFLIFLDKHPKYVSLIDKYRDNEEGMLFLYFSLVPDHPLYTLDWDEKLVSKCFKTLEERMDFYDRNPQEAMTLFVSGDDENTND